MTKMLSLDDLWKSTPPAKQSMRPSHLAGLPEGTEYHYADFGGFVESESTFGGYTIPTQLNIGWYFGTGSFESEGEFLRVKIDHADIR